MYLKHRYLFIRYVNDGLKWVCMLAWMLERSRGSVEFQSIRWRLVQDRPEPTKSYELKVLRSYLFQIRGQRVWYNWWSINALREKMAIWGLYRCYTLSMPHTKWCIWLLPVSRSVMVEVEDHIYYNRFSWNWSAVIVLETTRLCENAGTPTQRHVALLESSVLRQLSDGPKEIIKQNAYILQSGCSLGFAKRLCKAVGKC